MIKATQTYTASELLYMLYDNIEGGHFPAVSYFRSLIKKITEKHENVFLNWNFTLNCVETGL